MVGAESISVAGDDQWQSFAGHQIIEWVIVLDEEMTTVQIFKKTAEELDILKEYDKQPYREIIAILVKRNSGRIVKISDVKKEDAQDGNKKPD